MDKILPISVVIPTFNREELVRHAIDSVLRQSHPAAEIIVVDDGSQRDMREVLTSYGDKIKVLRQVNGGLSAARNTGIRAAANDWIAFLDDDDEYGPDRLAAAAASIHQFPNASVHAVNTLILAEGKPSLKLFEMRGIELASLSPIEHPLLAILRGCFFAQSLVIRKDTLFKVGLFIHYPYEDLDLFVRLAGHTPWILEPVPHLHLIRRTSSGYTLSANLRAKRIWSYTDLVRIHREALELPGLRESELRIIRTGLGTNLYELGRAYNIAGKTREARKCFKEAAQVFPARHSRLKSFVAACGGEPIIRLLQKLRRKPDAILR